MKIKCNKTISYIQSGLEYELLTKNEVEELRGYDYKKIYIYLNEDKSSILEFSKEALNEYFDIVRKLKLKNLDI